MYTNLFNYTLVLLFAILASNGIIYLLTNYHLHKKKLSVWTNSSKKDKITITFLIGCYSRALINGRIKITEQNFSNFERNEGNIPHNRDLIEINTNEQNRIIQDPVNTNTDFIDEIEANMVQNQETIPPLESVGLSSLDSITILDLEAQNRWLEIVMHLNSLPPNTPPAIIREVKLDEINILYSQDIISFGVSQTDLRLLIESIPIADLLQPNINHLILTMMSYLPL